MIGTRLARGAGSLARMLQHAQPSVMMARPASSPQQRRLSPAAAAYQEAMQPAQPGRIYTSYAIYKGKGAVAFKAILPTMKPVQKAGQEGGYAADYEVQREGALLLEFASVNQAQGGQTQYGARTYDWTNKITFALSVTELAQLTDFDIAGPAENKSQMELLHDPSKISGNQASGGPKAIKKLALALNQQSYGNQPPSGFLLSVNTKGASGENRNISVPVTRAEYVVLKHLAAYLVPRLLGYDQLA